MGANDGPPGRAMSGQSVAIIGRGTRGTETRPQSGPSFLDHERAWQSTHENVNGQHPACEGVRYNPDFECRHDCMRQFI
jgi:hypothetical protein